MDVEEGDRYYLYIGNGTAARGYCFIDSGANVLTVAASNETLHDVVVTAPANAVKLILNGGNGNPCYAYKINPILEELDEHESEITELQKNPMFRQEETYNLIDFVSDMMWNTRLDPSTGATNDNNGMHLCTKYIPVTIGDLITATHKINRVHFYDSDKTYISTKINRGNDTKWVCPVNVDNAAYVLVDFWSYESTGVTGTLAEGEAVSVYKVETTTRKSDRRPAVAHKQIDGRYITPDIYDVSIPATDSETNRILNMRAIKRENREKGAIRIGNFNVYGAMIKPENNWWTVKQELADYGLNICGFEEISVPTLDSDGLYSTSFKEIFTGEQFPYDDLGDNTGGGPRILSDCEVVSGGVYSHTVTTDGGDINVGYTKIVVNLPNYHHARDWDKTMSVYASHFSTNGNTARIHIGFMVDLINADTSDYKVLCADTNCFSRDSSGNPWCWALLAEAGLTPCLTDITKSTYCYPISQERWDNGELDMIDNVFISAGMKCINWNIVDSQDYPIAGVSGGHVSDHAMVYADVIFDYVDGFDDGTENDNTAMTRTVDTSASVALSADWNKKYVYTSALTDLVVTLPTAPTDVNAEIVIVIAPCGSTAPTITLPNDVVLVGDDAAADEYYEISINNELIAYARSVSVS